MPRVSYMLPMQGFRPNTNPLGALNAYGRRARLRGLGAQDPNCAVGMPYDVNGDLCAGVDPNCAQLMPYDVNGNPCPGPAGGASSSWGSTPTAAPNPNQAPTGSFLTYQGTWTTSITKTASDILQAVIAALPAKGLSVVSSSTTAGVLANTKLIFAEAGQQFGVTLQLQVTGPGFAQASDAASIVNHAVYVATGLMPTANSIVGGTGETPSGTSTLSSWLESNAVWIGLAVFAIAVVPAVIRRVL